MSVYNLQIVYRSRVKNSADKLLRRLNDAVTVKYKNVNKEELNFSLMKLKKQLQPHLMKSIKTERTKILLADALTHAKIRVLAERISLNKWEMTRKNLSLKSELTDMNSDLHIQQGTYWDNSDQLICTINSQRGLLRRVKKKDSEAEK